MYDISGARADGHAEAHHDVGWSATRPLATQMLKPQLSASRNAHCRGLSVPLERIRLVVEKRCEPVATQPRAVYGNLGAARASGHTPAHIKMYSVSATRADGHAEAHNDFGWSATRDLASQMLKPQFGTSRRRGCRFQWNGVGLLWRSGAWPCNRTAAIRISEQCEPAAPHLSKSSL